MNTQQPTETVYLPAAIIAAPGERVRRLPPDHPLFPRKIPLAKYVEDLPRSTRFAKYRNDTRTPMVVEFAVGRLVDVRQEGAPPRQHQVHDQVVAVFEPGVVVEVPVFWESVIHNVHQGVIQGGQAPRVTPLDHPEWKLSDNLFNEAEVAAPTAPHVAATDEQTLNPRGAR